MREEAALYQFDSLRSRSFQISEKYHALRYGFRARLSHGVAEEAFSPQISRRKRQMKISKSWLTTERGIIMKVTHRAAITISSAVAVAMLWTPVASACALTAPSAPVVMLPLLPDAQNPLSSATFSVLARDAASSAASASLVGMWSFQIISQGNTTHNPSIADGTQLNFGYIQFHSDETEIQNSGARSPAQENFCLGVWQKTGRSTYQVNHYALNYNATTGAFLGKILVIETLTVSPGGTALSGTFAETIYDATGNKTDHLTGQVTAQRVTVDTTTP
jgi:hypothetical protein